eukprot:jgi/Picsp_1/5389/NSC_02749-R1_hypothetical protein CHLNCDRAFT_142294 [Chlorella variabilis]
MHGTNWGQTLGTYGYRCGLPNNNNYRIYTSIGVFDRNKGRGRGSQKWRGVVVECWTGGRGEVEKANEQGRNAKKETGLNIAAPDGRKYYSSTEVYSRGQNAMGRQHQQQGSLWVVVLVSAGLTVSSILGAVTAMILYVRPLLKAAERAAESTDAAAQDVQNAAIEMEKTAIMFQQDVPTTMRELQKASDEWELVGKQLNVAVTSVTRPLKPVEKPVERAAEWVGEMVGEKSTAKFSKRIVSETTAVANSLWSSVNQLGQQLGFRGQISKGTAEAAKRQMLVGRKKQEARTWIDTWRRKGALLAAEKAHEAAKNGALSREKSKVKNGRQGGGHRPMNDLGYDPAAQYGMEEAYYGNDNDNTPSLDQDEELVSTSQYATEYMPNDPVGEVFSALARAQMAAEEAAASSTALEMAIERAEQSGMLSSSDEEEEDALEEEA